MINKIKTNIKIVIRVIVFFIILLIIILVLGYIVKPKRADNIENLRIKEMYNEPKDTIDILFMGNSNISDSILTMKLWNEYGITSYLVSSAHQKIWITYYLLEETLKYQSPKIIILDVDEIFDIERYRENTTRIVFDCMKMSDNKLKAILDPVFQNNAFATLNTIFPIFKYHSRWNSLEKDDFKMQDMHNKHIYKGTCINTEIVPTGIENNKLKVTKDREEIKKESLQYLNKIVKLCKKNNIEIILTSIPVITWKYSKYNSILDFANKNKIKYIDLNINNLSNINWKTDTRDGGVHLNINGAEKVTTYIGNFLNNNYRLQNHRGDKKYSNWEKILNDYNKEKSAKL